jgi:membrane-associated phospholipid phosphatase
MFAAFRDVDRLTLSFLALLAGISILFAPRIPHWYWLLLRYAAVAAAIALLARAADGSRPPAPAWYLHAFLPVLIVPIVFDSLGDMIPWIWDRSFDQELIRIDQALFLGNHPTVLLERFIHPLLTTALQFAYISYYPMAAVLGAVLVARARHAEFGESIFGIILCFYLSYIGYLLVPAVGPRFTLADVQTAGLQASPLVVAIQETLNRLENTKNDAFPSGHTAVALMTLYYAWKWREKVLTTVLVPCTAGLVLSTVYLRYHYVIDVIAGTALTGLTIWLAPRLRPFFSRATA